MFTFSVRQHAGLCGAAGLAAMLLALACEANAQTRPATSGGSRHPTSNTSGSGPSSRNSDGVQTPPDTSGRRSVPHHRPKTDVMDLRDRSDGAAGGIEATLGSVVPGVVTCEAGCDGPPGKVVYAALAVERPQVQPIQKASLVTAPDLPGSVEVAAEITCIAGCFNEPAWKRYGTRAPATVVLASLGVPELAPAAVPPPAPRAAAKVKRATAAIKSRRPVRTAVLASTPAAPEARIAPPASRLHVKRVHAKRFVVKSRHRAIVRKMRPNIINPSIQYPPRPLPVVRSANSTAAPRHKPTAPVGGFVTRVSFARPDEATLSAQSAIEVARHVARNPNLRSGLAVASDDWLNKARRETVPSIRVQ